MLVTKNSPRILAAASSEEAFCWSETENLEVLSDSIAQM